MRACTKNTIAQYVLPTAATKSCKINRYSNPLFSPQTKETGGKKKARIKQKGKSFMIQIKAKRCCLKNRAEKREGRNKEQRFQHLSCSSSIREEDHVLRYIDLASEVTLR